MALGTEDEVTKLKGTKILVDVEEALIDVLIVSFHCGTSIFQGALLDITKKNSPFGVLTHQPWDPTGGISGTTVPSTDKAQDVLAEEKAEKFHTLKQRHTYFQHNSVSESNVSQSNVGGSRRQVARNVRDQSVRMRRLRPRQVLCSQCQAICNENNENIQKKDGLPISRTKANNNSCNTATSNQGAYIDSKNTLNSSLNSDTKDQIGQSELSSTTNSCENSAGQMLGGSGGDSGDCEQTTVLFRSGPFQPSWRNSSQNGKGGEYQAVAPVEKSGRMILRKRKLSASEESTNTVSLDKQPEKNETSEGESKGSESNYGEGKNGSICVKSVLTKTSPVIKISFANPQGHDTVLKIPPRLQSASTSDTEEDNHWSLRENSEFDITKYASAKAAKKALKKAKKEAQRTTPEALCQNLENGELSLHKSRHHHHKHKLKRKKKHKDGDDEDDGDDDKDSRFFTTENDFSDAFKLQDGADEVNWSLTSTNLKHRSDTYYDDVKTKCLRRKLSISLKRLNAKAYMRCSPKYVNEEDPNLSEASNSSGGSVGSESECGDVPDFPKHEPLRDMDKVKPLMMRISTYNVKRCPLDNDREMTVGDIVWGKIHGFPWWPGKILALTVSQRDNGATINQQAHVSWFGSSTSSYMPCNQLTPFLDDFKIRYNRKKRGPYKEAIRQATLEAHQVLDKDMLPSELSLVT